MRAWLLMLLLTLVPRIASAQAQSDDGSSEKQQARQLLSQGNALYEHGDMKGALVDFRAAYAVYASPKLLVNMAAAERELGQLPEAAGDLRHFLDDSTGAEPELVDKASADLRVLERKLGRVDLVGWPDKTTIDLDGRTTRAPAYARPGTYAVTVRAPGGTTLTDNVQLEAGGHVEIGLPEGAQIAATAPSTEGTRLAVTKAAPVAHRPRYWIAGVVVGAAVLVGGAIALGVAFGSSSSPLKGDLGTYPFSSFK